MKPGKLLFVLLIITGCRSSEAVFESRTFEVVKLTSGILKEEREIFISIPRYELSDKIAEKKYPVIYVLDGDEMFDYVRGMVNFLSIEKGNDVLPKSIVVGIPNTNRARDLTPYRIPEDQDTGGGEQFARFLEQELIPYIDKHYAALQHRTLIGHSYGGLMAIYLLYQQPELFDNYIALDPSYRYLERQTDNFHEPKYEGKQLFVGIANTLPAGVDTSNYQLDVNTKHIDALLKWTSALERSEDSKLASWSKYYEADDHASLCVAATYDALRTLFSWYHLDVSILRQNEEKTKNIRQILEAHHELLAEKFGESLLPDEALVNKAAWLNLRADPSTTQDLLHMNLRNYPASFNANFTLGNFYSFVGKTDSARMYLEAALRIRDDEKAKAMLHELEK